MKRGRQNNGFCPECRKPLQATTCLACGGRSYHRPLLISKRPCTRCEGTGKEYQCSDQFSHNEDELRVIKQRRVDEWIRSYGQPAMY
jgi:hypothetical protein